MYWVVENNRLGIFLEIANSVKLYRLYLDTLIECYGYYTIIQRLIGKLGCYDLKLKVSSSKTTLVLSNTRELDRVPSTK